MKRCCLPVLLLLGLLPLTAADVDPDEQAAFAFIEDLDGMGLHRLALQEADRLWQERLIISDDTRLRLAIRLNRLHLTAAAQAKDAGQRQRHRRRARSLYEDVSRRSRGDASLADSLDLGLVHFHHGEAVFEDWRRRRTIGNADEALKALRSAVTILGTVIDRRDESLAERERQLPPRAKVEQDPRWRRLSEELNSAIYHRGWSHYYIGELEPARAQTHYRIGLGDLEEFAYGNPANLIVVRSLIGASRCLDGLGQDEEALELLIEAQGKPMPRSHRLLLLNTHCDLIGTKDLPDPLFAVLTGNLGRLEAEQLRKDPVAARLTRRWLRDLLRRQRLQDSAERRRTGIRQSEQLIAAGGDNLGAGLQGLIELTAGDQNSSRLGALLQAEQAFEAGDLDTAATGYAAILAKPELLPEGELPNVIRTKYAALLQRLGKPAEALTVLAQLPEQVSPQAVAELVDLLTLRCREQLWLQGRPDSLRSYMADLDRLVGKSEDDRAAEALLRGLTLLHQRGAQAEADALLARLATQKTRTHEVELFAELFETDQRVCDLFTAKRFIYLLFAGRGSLRPATVSYVALHLARRCDQDPQLAEQQSQFARLVLDQATAPADQRRRACFYLLRADQRRGALRTSLTIAEEISSEAAWDVWEAASLLELGDALLELEGPQAKRATDLALACWRAAVDWYASQGHEQQANGLRYRLASTLLGLGRGKEAQAWFDRLPADQRDTWEVLRGKADSLMTQGKHRDALAIWRNLADRLRSGSSSWLIAKAGMARCLLALDETAQALKVVVFTRELHADLGDQEQVFAELERQCRARLGK